MDKKIIIEYVVYGLAIFITVIEFISDIRKIKSLNEYLNGIKTDNFIVLDFIINAIVRDNRFYHGFYLSTTESNQLHLTDLIYDKSKFELLKNMKINTPIKVKVKRRDFERETRKSKSYKRDRTLKYLNFEIYELRDENNTKILFNDNLDKAIFKEYKKEKRQNIFLATLKPIAIIGFYIIYRLIAK